MARAHNLKRRWSVLLAFALGVVVACSLNPQPLPPESPVSGDAGTGGDMDSTTLNGSDAGARPDSAISDSGPLDASDASDAPVDAPSDAALEGGG
jgi:hypothetical protein